MNKNFIQIISLLELLLLIILGILSNKISEILQVSRTFLWIATLLVVTALVVITLYKNRSADSNSPNFFKVTPNLQITKKTVGGVLRGLIYYPSALMLSTGAFAFSRAIDTDWLGILSGSVVSGTLIFAFLFLDRIKEEKQNILPFAMGLLLSSLYAAIGMYIDAFPEFFDSNLFLLAMISAVTFVGLKYVYLYYTFFTWFEKWYKSLPES